jgi:CPA1 family monovalent cation:H+ antiporter
MVLFFLLAVVVSGAVSRMVPIAIPTPLVQIALGAVIGLSSTHRVDLDPDLFLLLFLPPLLFLDGWRIPRMRCSKTFPPWSSWRWGWC